VIGCLFCIKTTPIGNPLVLVHTSNDLESFKTTHESIKLFPLTHQTPFAILFANQMTTPP
jgi:hypothetical protein